MLKAFLQIRRLMAAATVLGLSACASQSPSDGHRPIAPVAKASPSERPPIAPVEYRSFEADTLYALLVAEIAGARSRYDIAVANYVQQALATRDPGITARAARIARLLNAHDAALEMAFLWLELEPNNIEAHFIAGAELARAGELTEAAEHAAVLLDQGEEGFFEAIAASATQTKDEQLIKQLHDKYANWLRQHPHSASLQLGQSLLLHSMGQHEQALDAARRASQIDPDNYQANLQEMRILEAMGRGEEAQQGLALLVEKYPDNQRLRLQYARMLANSDLATAQTQFKTLVEQSPGDPDFTFSLGLIQMERGLLSDAAGQFQSLTNGGEHSDSAHYYLGQIAESSGDLDMALHHYLLVGPGQEYLPAVVRAAEILMEMGGSKDALEYLRHERADAAGDNRANIYLLEAELLNEMNDASAALQTLVEGLQEFPESVRLLYARAMMFTEMDQLAQAEQDLKQIITMSPNNAAALNALGYTLADRTDRLDEAHQYIHTALQLEPNDAAILDSMGWVNYRMGKLDEAVKYLRKAMTATPDHEIAAHLGEVLWVIGEQQEARDAWKNGLELEPGSHLIKETLERLNVDLGGN